MPLRTTMREVSFETGMEAFDAPMQARRGRPVRPSLPAGASAHIDRQTISAMLKR